MWGCCVILNSTSLICMYLWMDTNKIFEHRKILVMSTTCDSIMEKPILKNLQVKRKSVILKNEIWLKTSQCLDQFHKKISADPCLPSLILTTNRVLKWREERRKTKQVEWCHLGWACTSRFQTFLVQSRNLNLVVYVST